MRQMLPSSRTSFELRDVSTGVPHLDCSGSLTDRRYLSRLERDPRDLQVRAAIAIHLPRLALIACGAAAVLFGFVVLGKAESATSTSSARRMTAEGGLQARVSCLAGEETRALAIYDDILSASGIAERPAL